MPDLREPRRARRAGAAAASRLSSRSRSSASWLRRQVELGSSSVEVGARLARSRRARANSIAAGSELAVLRVGGPGRVAVAARPPRAVPRSAGRTPARSGAARRSAAGGGAPSARSSASARFPPSVSSTIEYSRPRRGSGSSASARSIAARDWAYARAAARAADVVVAVAEGGPGRRVVRVEPRRRARAARCPAGSAPRRS